MDGNMELQHEGGDAITPREYDCQLSRTKMCLPGLDIVNVVSHCTTIYYQEI